MLIIEIVAEPGNTDLFSGKRKQYCIYISSGIHPKEISGFLADPTFYLTPEVWFNVFLSTSMVLFQWLSWS